MKIEGYLYYDNSRGELMVLSTNEDGDYFEMVDDILTEGIGDEGFGGYHDDWIEKTKKRYRITLEEVEA